MAEDLPSKTQLDKLGDRLREGSRTEADLRALDDYRRSFRQAYDTVVGTLSQQLGLKGTGRPAKTTAAIVDKLNRQRIRLTQIQDIAGLRVLSKDVLHQDRIVDQLTTTFSGSGVDDRRAKPSNGYRAVHVIVPRLERLVEVQIRTPEQHLWAELSEKLSDVFDSAIKYGGGPEWARESLLKGSALTSRIEAFERNDANLAVQLANLEAAQKGAANRGERVEEAVREILTMKLKHQNQGRLTKELKEILAEVLIDQYNNVRREQP